MDVELPDGTVIEGVPDGTTKADLAARLKRNGMQVPDEWLAAPRKGARASTLEERQQREAEVQAGMRDLVGGGVRGAAGIGSTLLTVAQADKAGLPFARRGELDSVIQQTMGANPDSMTYGGGKLLAEIAGTAGTGGALAKALPFLPAAARTAIATSGMRTGLPPSLGNLALRTGAGAAVGGTSAALIDPERAATGAAIGGLLPGAAQATGWAARKAGEGAGNVAAMFSDQAAGKKAAEQVRAAIGEPNIRQAVGDLQTYFPKGAENIPVSSAGVTGSKELARLEQASRLRKPADWAAFDEKQAGAVWQNVQKATEEADMLAERFAKRAENWADNWAEASAKIKPRVFARRMGELYGSLQQAKASPYAANKEVAAALDEIESTVMRFGKGFTPAHLQQMRAEFNGKVKPMAASALKAVPRDVPAIKSLIDEMDDILNATTSGKWDKVRAGYAADSEAVRAAKAAQLVRGAFVDQATGRVMRAADAAGDLPRVTDAGLTRAMNAARMPGTKAPALSADATQRLEATLDALRRQAIVQNVKRAASAGGGSDTAGNLTSLLGNQVAPGAGGNALRGLLDLGRNAATGRVQSQLMTLLSDPDLLAATLSRQPMPGHLLDDLSLLTGRSVPLLGSAALSPR